MFTNNYILNPNHKIEVLLIGCGGTGSFLLSELSGLSSSLKEMDHLGFNITVMDHDIVESQNVGRQKFSYADIGGSKARVLGSRINRFYGNNDIEAFAKEFKANMLDELRPNIIITAVDNVQIRKDIHEYLKKKAKQYNKHKSTFYWIDCGNSKDYGQIVCASYCEDKTNLPSIIDLHPDIEDKPEEPSCSMRASLMKQSYMVNKFTGSYVMELLSGMFIDYKIKFNALYFNLNNFKTKMKM